MSQPSANPIPNPVIPLNGLLEIQQNYLNDLERITLNGSVNTTTALSGVQQKLADLNSSFSNANTSANSILTQQDKMKDIIDKEYERISLAKQEVDNIHLGKMRYIELNDSYRKRHVDYMRIVLAILVALIIYVLVALFVPEPIYSISLIIVFSVLLIYSGSIGLEIYKRENTNHDRLNLKPPSKLREDKLLTPSAAPSTASTSVPGSTTCVGEACCSSDSRWDAPMNKCIKKCVDPTPISSGDTCIAQTACASPMKICGNACIGQNEVCGSTSTNPFSTLGEERIQTKHDNNVQPYSPFEYSEYSRI